VKVGDLVTVSKLEWDSSIAEEKYYKSGQPLLLIRISLGHGKVGETKHCEVLVDGALRFIRKRWLKVLDESR